MINSYDIVLDVDRILHYSRPKLIKLKDDTLLVLIKGFAKHVRNEYFNRIYDDIYARRYNGDWEPVEDPGYRDYLGTIPSTTNILDMIDEALEIRENKGKIYIRINPDYMYPDSDHSLLEVIRAIDHGTSKFNSRPLVAPIARYINKTWLAMWGQYMYQKGVI